jgi:putative flavoprotein involved in K+ transport
MTYDVIIIGGGQSGLACGYYLRRTGLSYIIIDDQEKCGGAWQKSWDSLTLFSPSEQSSLPGWLMPRSKNAFPDREEVISYLCAYEERYSLPVKRPVEVKSVVKEKNLYNVKTDKEDFFSKAVISSTGTWHEPFIPKIQGKESFKGKQVHSAFYKNPKELQGQKVLIVGEGNSGAQILAEVSKVADAVWATIKEPQYLPDDVDGRVLFNVATAKYHAQKTGKTFDQKNYNLGNIVMVPSVKEARDRDVLHSKGNFIKMYDEGVVWQDGSKEKFDTIIWCTGFNFATRHLRQLVNTNERGRIKTSDTRAKEIEGLWLVGYGGWTGFASATLIGVGRSARKTVKEVQEYLNNKL